MRLRLAKEPFDHPDYLFELKHDGFRALVYLQNGECKIISRNQRNLAFESLKKTLAKLPVRDAILDGEIVCLDARGVSQFSQLLYRRGQPVFYCFDLLWRDGEDLRPLPLVERKRRLNQLVRKSHCPQILYAQHLEYAGKWLFSEICEQDLEGIVCKRRDGVYRDDGDDWLKVKNPKYSQAVGRHELLTRAK